MKSDIKLYSPIIRKNTDSFIPVTNIDYINVYARLYNKGYNVEFLRENLKSLKLSYRSLDGDPCYLIGKNKIEIPKKLYKDSITHELLHCATAVIDGHAMHLGFQYNDFKTGKTYGECLNEGVTTILDEELFGNYTKTKLDGREKIYPFSRRIAEYLLMVVPEELLYTYYFNADLIGLIEYLDNFHHDKNKVMQFISDLDVVYYYLDKEDISIFLENKEYLLKCYERVQMFLAESVYAALTILYENGDFTKKEYKMYLSNCKEILRNCLYFAGERVTTSKVRKYKKIEENYKNKNA